MPERITLAEMAVAGESDDIERWVDIVEDLPIRLSGEEETAAIVDALRLAYEAGRARFTLAEAEEEARGG